MQWMYTHEIGKCINFLSLFSYHCFRNCFHGESSYNSSATCLIPSFKHMARSKSSETLSGTFFRFGFLQRYSLIPSGQNRLINHTNKYYENIIVEILIRLINCNNIFIIPFCFLESMPRKLLFRRLPITCYSYLQDELEFFLPCALLLSSWLIQDLRITNEN